MQPAQLVHKEYKEKKVILELKAYREKKVLLVHKGYKEKKVILGLKGYRENKVLLVHKVNKVYKVKGEKKVILVHKVNRERVLGKAYGPIVTPTQAEIKCSGTTNLGNSYAPYQDLAYRVNQAKTTTG